MKKLIIIVLLAISTTATACPKGMHPHGGTGSHHKGGWCSYNNYARTLSNGDTIDDGMLCRKLSDGSVVCNQI